MKLAKLQLVAVSDMEHEQLREAVSTAKATADVWTVASKSYANEKGDVKYQALFAGTPDALVEFQKAIKVNDENQSDK